MEQIRQILQQMSLNLQLNIAMCDMLDDQGKRIAALETSRDAHKLRLDALASSMAQLSKVVSNGAYMAQRSSMSADNK